MNRNRSVLLSFDVEEFDMPLEYGHAVSPETQLKTGYDGLKIISGVLTKNQVPATLFTTANFATHFPDSIKTLSHSHEIASHTYYHSSFKEEDLLLSKIKLENITGKPVEGLRMPRMRPVDMNLVEQAGYSYDSSINPTWLPGRYNNFSKPRTFYTEKNMLRIPATVSPVIRVPLFWLAFKNLPYALFKMLALKSLRKDNYICLYFHPWEFTAIQDFNIPGYTKRLAGEPLTERLDRLIHDLKKEGDFMPMGEYVKQYVHRK